MVYGVCTSVHQKPSSLPVKYLICKKDYIGHLPLLVLIGNLVYEYTCKEMWNL